MGIATHYQAGLAVGKTSSIGSGTVSAGTSTKVNLEYVPPNTSTTPSADAMQGATPGTSSVSSMVAPSAVDGESSLPPTAIHVSSSNDVLAIARANEGL